MIYDIACSSVVTKKSLDEFRLLDFTISQYHNVRWYLSVDPYVEEFYKDSEKHNCLQNIDSDEDAKHCGTDATEQSKIKFMHIMKTKAYASDFALSQGEDFVLFLDSDIFFVNPIDEKVLELFTNKSIDAFLCPHATFNHSNEAKVGFFNAGMYCTSSRRFLGAWMDINNKAYENNLYGDQKPLELIYNNFVTVNLPINYDIGFWRMNEQHNHYRFNQLGLGIVDEVFNLSNGKHNARPDNDDTFSIRGSANHVNLLFMGHPAVCFHAHTFKDLGYTNYGAFLVEKVLHCLRESGRPDHKRTLEFMAKMQLGGVC